MTLPAVAQPVSVGQTTRTNPAPSPPRGQTREITGQNRQALLQEGSRLTSAQVEAIETDLKRNPSDEAQWVRLLGYGPDLALAKDLLDLGENQAVLTFFEECNVFWTTGRDSLVQWKKTILAGQKPDFGPGFHFGFKRLQP